LNCSPCGQAHRQFLFCFRGNRGEEKELPIGQIKSLLGQLGSQRPRIYISGGDVLGYSSLEELCQLLRGEFPETVFFLHLSQAIANLSAVNVIVDHGFPIQIGVMAPFNGNDLAIVRQKIMEKGGFCSTMLLVQNPADVIAAEKIMEQSKQENGHLQPFFNGENYLFFQENVFSEKEHVCLACLSQKEIFARLKTNPQQFGSMIITADGSVYANLHARRLGSLAKNSIHEMLLKELKGGKTWLHSRNKVKPCHSCIWHALCPPVSNYEHALGRHDMCWRHQEDLQNA
jgi:pseudo-rSAM protein